MIKLNQSSVNLSKDYSGNKKWREYQRTYSRAQLDFPLGLGTKKVLQMKRMILGWLPLWCYSPEDLAGLIRKLRREYVRKQNSKKS